MKNLILLISILSLSYGGVAQMSADHLFFIHLTDEASTADDGPIHTSEIELQSAVSSSDPNTVTATEINNEKPFTAGNICSISTQLLRYLDMEDFEGVRSDRSIEYPTSESEIKSNMAVRLKDVCLNNPKTINSNRALLYKPTFELSNRHKIELGTLRKIEFHRAMKRHLKMF